MKYLTIFLSLFIVTQNCELNAQNNSIEKNLNKKEKAIVAIASLTAKGDLENLKGALTYGLEAGLTVNEIKEVMVHLYAYSGFPRSILGLRTFKSVLEERKAKGITDTLGKEASTVLDNRSKYDRGKEILEKLVNRPINGPKADYAEFSPILEVFLKEHLFADIFERDILNYKQRELVTVTVLITLGDLEPMLKSHMNICMLQGITSNQLQELLQVIEIHVDTRKITAAKQVLDELLETNTLSNTEITENEPMKATTSKLIFPKGKKITNTNFTGNAYLTVLIQADSINKNAVGSVTFEPNARTNWHLHPNGQIILVLDGEGYYQEKGSPKKTIHKGDVVKCPANVPHWHGASPNSEFIQIAITSRVSGPTEWLNPVTEEEYNKQ
ncbi:carboxymuconolactone decarboxylase family protein [Flaviramulus sp. BrNp1-15]|uniref:carboxymuconolactone decarboxylase family protein n=1 Tax=Flaviramulus sp. BrNp1-15 TaxID=2916754 RepID=UPI001EE94C8E|nr:carboxymuconolactone decarboxylase family protein [Flaviramulus sp. BrNp1-15]ULC60209.1 carboxymuconolactone decarboxylase family protein [Flaviramulus sp. BrNp1-15]